jgi:hypothetical protein
MEPSKSTADCKATDPATVAAMDGFYRQINTVN